jgi:5'-deoxynucleotidase YfbR-like HD superfamily hydrolase
MTWIVTSSGREIDLLNPDPTNIVLRDLVRAVGNINRFTGHTVRPYSVLEHSLNCADYARIQGWSSTVVFACLCHDLHEGLIGDISTPVKLAVPEIRTFEKHIEHVVHHRLGIAEIMEEHAEQVKQADLALLLWERDRLLKHTSPWPAEQLVTVPYTGEMRPRSYENALEEFYNLAFDLWYA